LRGLKLQDIILSAKLPVAYSDLSLQLRWIADKSHKIYTLPKIPSSKKPYGEPFENVT